MSDDFFGYIDNFGYTAEQIEELTPDIAGQQVIATLTWLVEVAQKNGKGYLNAHYGHLICSCDFDYKNVHKVVDSIQMFVDQPLETYAEMKNSFFILSSMVYALGAGKEYKVGKTQHAWVLAMQAERFLGMAMGSNPHSQLISFVKRQTAAINGVKSRKEEIQIKEFVLEYYQKHITEFNGKNAADEIFKEKLAPVTLESIERWIRKFHKENPDIPKPTKKPKSVKK